MSLKIRLYSPLAFTDNDGVDIFFEVTNTSSDVIQFLKWYTPLEGLRSSCLRVQVGRKNISYDGIKVKRGTPTEENFVFLEGGQTIIQKINLEEAYDLPLRGMVKVEFDASNVVAVNTSKINKSLSLFHEVKKHRLKKINTVGCAFSLRRNKKSVKPLGAQMRTKRKSGPGLLDTPKDPLTTNMNDAERAKMKAAHIKGHAMAKDSLDVLANDSKYKKWFGAHSTARFSEVKSVYTKIKAGLEAKQFTYINNGPQCGPNDIAYTYDGSDKVWICKTFWTLSATGLDSQAGTVVHEHSHAAAHTDDHAYGTDDCIQLAKNDPAKAIDNGDNYEYYSES